MNTTPTSEKILHEALNLFAKKGFESVTVEQIAIAVGIKAPSIYKHYKSKEAIFEALLEKINDYYRINTRQMNLHFSMPGTDMGMFERITEQHLIDKVKEFFDFSVHDTFVKNARKMLLLEQFRNPQIAEIYTRQFFTIPMDYHKQLFTYLIKANVLKSQDPKIMALQYVSPILELIALCDREPEKEPQATELLETHIQLFNKMYRVENVEIKNENTILKRGVASGD